MRSRIEFVGGTSTTVDGDAESVASRLDRDASGGRLTRLTADDAGVFVNARNVTLVQADADEPGASGTPGASPER